MDKKIDLIFDANNLASGADKACFRTGVYFATMNILKYFLKSELLNIKLYCDCKNLGKLNIVLSTDFQGYDVEIISNVPFNFLTNTYNYFLEKRTNAKNNKQKGKKIFFDLIVRFLFIFQSLQKRIYEKKLYDTKAGIYFSPQNVIPIQFNSLPIKKFTILYDAIPTI